MVYLRLQTKLLVLTLVFCLSLTALAGSFNVKVSRGYETLQLESGAGYTDKTSTLLDTAAIDWVIAGKLGVFAALEKGSTVVVQVDTDHSYPIDGLKGHYSRQMLGAAYYVGKGDFKVGVGIGLDLDREQFSWTGNNDNTVNRQWQWDRNSIGVAGLARLVYDGQSAGFTAGISYTPFFKSDETLEAEVEDTWESWETAGLDAVLLKVNGEITVSLARYMGLVVGVSYRDYRSPETNVPSFYKNSNGDQKEMEVQANKVAEKGAYIYAGIKVSF